MRIGLFSDTYLPCINGVATSIDTLKKTLEKQGHQVYIVTANPIDGKYSYENRVFRIPGMKVGIFDYRLTSIYPIRAIKRIKSWNLDVIHSQSEFGIGSFARILSKQLNIPIVHTYHTMYEDHAVYLNKGHFRKLSDKIVKQLTEFLCDRTINELIVPTQKAYDLFKNKYKVEREIYIVPTGIETKDFAPSNFSEKTVSDLRKSYNINEGDITLLWVGRLGPEKNIEFLVKNHNDIVKKCPNCKLVIIGDGPSKEKLEKLSNENVIFVGRIPFEKMPLYYQLGDILVTASVTETQGLTVNEGMSASLPVVAIDDDAFRNTITDGYDGIIFKNKRGYVDGVLNVIRNLETMKRNALISSKKFTCEVFASRVLGVYEIALGDKKPKKKNIFKRIFGGNK